MIILHVTDHQRLRECHDFLAGSKAALGLQHFILNMLSDGVQENFTKFGGVPLPQDEVMPQPFA